MGYRSDVSVVFYTSNEERMPFAAIKLWFDENYPKFDFGCVETGSDCVLVTYESVKWYTGYDEVTAVEAAIALFVDTFDANNDTSAHYEMIRVGEELPDIERDASDWCQWRLDVSRTIHFN